MSLGWAGEKVRLVPLDREKHFENVAFASPHLRWALPSWRRSLPQFRAGTGKEFHAKTQRPQSKNANKLDLSSSRLLFVPFASWRETSCPHCIGLL